MLSLCLTTVEHICVSGRHKLQVVCAPNGKVCFKWTAWRFGNWILPSSIARQICKVIVRCQDCSNWVPLVAHIMGLCVREHNKWKGTLVFPQVLSAFASQPEVIHLSTFLTQPLKVVFAELV